MLLHKKKLYLFLLIFLSLSIIFSLLFPQRWLIKLISHVICPNAVYFKVTDEPIVALTIDDSPDVNTTKQILTVLAKYKKIVATFFPISNQVAEHQTILKAIVKDGHEIGNHLTEDEPSIKLGEKFETELGKAHQTLSDFTTIKWLRPGNGWCNQAMVEIAQKYGYQIALGSVWSYDTHILSSNFATWFILANTKPG